jgi:hypothetical protein
MVITGEFSSELQQYLHLEGQPSVGMSITWKGFFITPVFPPVRDKGSHPDHGPIPAGSMRLVIPYTNRMKMEKRESDRHQGK